MTRVLASRAWIVAFVVVALVAPVRGRQTQNDADPLQTARRLYGAYQWTEAIAELDRVIELLDARRKRDASAAPVLAEAIELRARARFAADDIQGARSDLMSLFQAFPAQTLPEGVSPPFAALFNDVKRVVVGELSVHIQPTDATFELDGERRAVTEEPLPIVAGTHAIVIKRPGHRTVTQTVQVQPGTRFELPVTLERTSAVLRLVTIPAGVEVFVNNASRGTTQPTTAPVRADTDGELPSSPLLLTDLQVGTVLLEFRRDCYLRAETRFNVAGLTDYDIPAVSLKRAEGEVSVDSTPTGATVVLDGDARGNAPIALKSVCEGSHTVELRSMSGRYVRRLELRAGQTEAVRGVVRPAFALLPAVGVAEDRGPEYERRLRVERRLGDVGPVTFFVPPARDIEAAMREGNVPSGWLRVDGVGRFQGDSAEGLTSRDRAAFASALSLSLGVQGIVTVGTPVQGARDEVVLAVLALGSGEPDVMALQLDDSRPVAALIDRLNAVPQLFTRSLGLGVIDVIDHSGPEVSEIDDGVSASTGLRPGDTIAAIGEHPLTGPGAFERGLEELSLTQPVSLLVRRGSAERRVELAMRRVPNLMSNVDRTIMFNPLLVQLRAQAAVATDPGDLSLINLQSGVALMHGGNWREALATLERVKLPSGSGVSRGTVLYLTALCLEGLDQRADAEAMLRQALSEPESLLTPEGPSIKQLAESKLHSGTAR